MAKGRNLIKTEPITVSVNVRVYEALEQLTKGGFWGKNVADTAEEMIRRGIATLEGGSSLMAASLVRPTRGKQLTQPKR